MSHGSTVTIEELAKEVPGRLWFQNFMYRDRGLTRSFTERAQTAGYRALVLTVDNQVLGQRERDLRNGFDPPRITWRSVLDVGRALPWALRIARRSLTFANYVSEERKDIVSLAAYLASMLDPTLHWKDVDWLRGIWRGPLLLKGVLHPIEARLAVEHGIDGVIVSNHGGRQLDTALPAIRPFPPWSTPSPGASRCCWTAACGAAATWSRRSRSAPPPVLIGRPHLWGLAVAGEAGVAQVLEIFRRDIDRVLALGGWDGIAQVDRGALAPATGALVGGERAEQVKATEMRAPLGVVATP